MKRFIFLILLTCSVSLFADQWRGIAVTSEDIRDNTILFNRAGEGETVFITSIDSGKRCSATVSGKAEDSKYVAFLSQDIAQKLDVDGTAAEIIINTDDVATREAPKESIQLYEVLEPFVQELPEIKIAAVGSAYRHSINDIPLCFGDKNSESESNLDLNSETEAEFAETETESDENELSIPQELSESLSAAMMADAAEAKSVKWVEKLEKGKVYIKILSSENKNELEKYSKTIAMFFDDSLILHEADDMRCELLLGPINENNVGQSIRIVRDYGYKDAYLIRGK